MKRREFITLLGGVAARGARAAGRARAPRRRTHESGGGRYAIDGQRHACGYALANAGHDTRALQAWLGHKNIQHTVRYTELAPDRFKNFWR
jgi:integrase